MGRVNISAENQIERLNLLEARMKKMEQKSLQELIKRPGEKSWSALEAIEHMNMGYIVYEPKIETALKQLSTSDPLTESVRSTAIPSFLIKRFPPQKGKIRFKMKTMRSFQPVLEINTIRETELADYFERFYRSLDKLKEFILAYRQTKVEKVRFNSAIGAIVKFNVAEAVEFILCHNERHCLQAEKALNILEG
ncbi:MAG: hypothetical protein MI810_15565 [Flavobacteriales bacterium]|nr:hypothetical protein [Flavobacteriales bacterium]